jgi:hypothetical protein
MRVVAPHIGFGYLTIRIIASGWQISIVTKNLADSENACRRATVALPFPQSRLVSTGQTGAPSETIPAKQRRKWGGNRCPIAAGRSSTKLKLSVHRIPIGCEAEDELRAIARHTIGTRVADQKDERAAEKSA